jgi:hypothetical protein
MLLVTKIIAHSVDRWRCVTQTRYCEWFVPPLPPPPPPPQYLHGHVKGWHLPFTHTLILCILMMMMMKMMISTCIWPMMCLHYERDYSLCGGRADVRFCTTARRHNYRPTLLAVGKRVESQISSAVIMTAVSTLFLFSSISSTPYPTKCNSTIFSP